MLNTDSLRQFSEKFDYDFDAVVSFIVNKHTVHQYSTVVLYWTIAESGFVVVTASRA